MYSKYYVSLIFQKNNFSLVDYRDGGGGGGGRGQAITVLRTQGYLPYFFGPLQETNKKNSRNYHHFEYLQIFRISTKP